VAAPFLNFFAFDLLYLKRIRSAEAALIDRRQLLMSICCRAKSCGNSEHFVVKATTPEAVRAKGLEGIVAKQVQSRYESRRSGS